MAVRAVLVLLLAACAAGCGNDNPTDPDDNGNGCFAIVGNRGTVTATISGLPAFSGVIPTGQAILTPAATPAPALFVVHGTDTRTGTSVLVGGPMIIGPTAASISSINGASVQVLVTTRTCTAGTGSWIGNVAFGAAAVNVATATATAVSGSFSGTLEPVAGSGAAGTKTISGNFSGTF